LPTKAFALLPLLAATVVLAGAAPAAAAPLIDRSTTTVARTAAIEALHAQLLHAGMPVTDIPTCQLATGQVGVPATLQDCPEAAPATLTAPSPADSDARVTVTKRASIPIATGYIAALPLAGLTQPAAAHVHSYGAVGVTDLQGRSVWNRSDVSFVKEVSDLRAYMEPFVAMGRDPLYPTTRLGDHPFAVADLTGDGVDDIAVAHLVRRLAAPTVSTVDVLDGTDGHTAWMGIYSGLVVELVIVDDTLVIAQETGDPTEVPGGVAGERSSLHGVHFSHGRGTAAWSRSTGASGARWLSLTATGDAIAAGWSATPIGTTSGPHGALLSLDATTGAQRWTTPTNLYPRMVRWDAGRSQVDLLEQSDPFAADGPSYRITPYAIATGAAGTTTTFPNAIPLQLEVADLSGDAAAEWTVSEVQLAPSAGFCANPDLCASTGGLQTGSRLASYSPDTGKAIWEKSFPAAGGELASHPMAYDLAVASSGGSRVVVASSFTPAPANNQLAAYAGADGSQLWATRGSNLAFPLYMSTTSVGGRAAILTATGRIGLYGANAAAALDQLNSDPVTAIDPYNVISTRAIDTGALLDRAALLGEFHTAVPLDVDDDSTRDLVVGTDSGAVVALDGKRLTDDPGVLWRTVLPTQVHELRSADVDGDGRSELVATAAHSVAVLDGRTGALRWSAAFPTTFQWTSAVADLDRDGDDDVLVPSGSLTAYEGRSGSPLWSYTPPGADTYAFGTPAVAEGAVAAQYVAGVGADVSVQGYGVTPTSHSENDVLLDAATGAVRWTHSQPSQDGVPNLWKASVLARGVAGVPGLAAAFTWDSTGTDGIAHPTIDVYDATTGSKAVSATSAEGVGNTQTLVVGGYVEEISSGRSMGIGPTGASVDNLSNLGGLTAEPAIVGDHEFFAVAGFGGRINVFAPSALGTLTPVAVGGLSVPDNNGGLVVGDVDGNSSDDLIGLPFNWDGFAYAELAGGRFSFAVDVAPRALNILTMADEDEPAPTVPEAPYAVLLLLVALGIFGLLAHRRQDFGREGRIPHA
jgi:hypothetical protein